ncbi:uncharacterized protein K452DRAFT_292452 [Aplosporella prunicola CBS 121167]|uniref:F-box domain-containing protein n=1 Tax=Aplosporella prunicola CBS 121167 TaxID=1176127 RepID=A0A6A6AZD0_9PEZI|nr:uncharacterized protein K452DRAFT_292452 [Aplosporella prunicola CBS 121167]KAF2136364.1 hypothetical protein K452DRAFT_292452 [Aplosporella prunicola CBS 121167]
MSLSYVVSEQPQLEAGASPESDDTFSPLERLPYELQDIIIGFLEVPAIIRMRCASKFWRSRIDVSESRPHIICQERRSLVCLYYDIISKPWFQASRENIIPRLGPSEAEARRQLLDRISTEHVSEFEVWLREWPAKAVIGRIWPWISQDKDSSNKDWWWTVGDNFSLGWHMPLPIHDQRRDPCYIMVDSRSNLDSRCHTDQGQLRTEGWGSPKLDDPELRQTHFSPETLTIYQRQDSNGYYSDTLILSGGGPFNGTIHQGVSKGKIFLGANDEQSDRSRCSSSWVDYLREKCTKIESEYNKVQRMNEMMAKWMKSSQAGQTSWARSS